MQNDYEESKQGQTPNSATGHDRSAIHTVQTEELNPRAAVSSETTVSEEQEYVCWRAQQVLGPGTRRQGVLDAYSEGLHAGSGQGTQQTTQTVSNSLHSSSQEQASGRLQFAGGAMHLEDNAQLK